MCFWPQKGGGGGGRPICPPPPPAPPLNSHGTSTKKLSRVNSWKTWSSFDCFCTNACRNAKQVLIVRSFWRIIMAIHNFILEFCSKPNFKATSRLFSEFVIGNSSIVKGLHLCFFIGGGGGLMIWTRNNNTFQHFVNDLNKDIYVKHQGCRSKVSEFWKFYFLPTYL